MQTECLAGSWRLIVTKKFYLLSLTVSLLLLTSVPDPRRFDTDPDSRICSSGLRIRIRVRILFLAGGGEGEGLDWCMTKNGVNYIRIPDPVHVLQTIQVVKKSQNCRKIEIKVFLIFLLLIHYRTLHPAHLSEYEKLSGSLLPCLYRTWLLHYGSGRGGAWGGGGRDRICQLVGW